jgi:hypothetical protein
MTAASGGLVGTLLPDWEARKAWLDHNEHFLGLQRVVSQPHEPATASRLPVPLRPTDGCQSALGHCYGANPSHSPHPKRLALERTCCTFGSQKTEPSPNEKASEERVALSYRVLASLAWVHPSPAQSHAITLRLDCTPGMGWAEPGTRFAPHHPKT